MGLFHIDWLCFRWSRLAVGTYRRLANLCLRSLKKLSEHRALKDPAAIKRFAAACLLLALPLAVYQPCLEGDFIWDDDKYVSQNLRSFDGLIRCWTGPQATQGSQFYPLVYTSFWLEYRTWGLNPYGYHRNNVLLHGLCSMLFWILLRRLAVPGAFLAASIFALHPVCVESVAWITERKNVLSLAFALASLLAYLRFAGCFSGEDGTAGETPTRRWAMYGISLFLFACALLSKTVTATLPVVIVLLIWWKSGKISRSRLLPLLPFFAVGCLMALLTMSVEADHMGTDRMPFFQELAFPERLIAAGKASWFYAGKLIRPVNLCFIYPQLATVVASPLSYVPLIGIVTLAGLLWALQQCIGRGPLAAVLIYLVVVGPALGFFDIAQMRFSFVADHWVYHASTALIALGAAGVALAGRRLGTIDPRLAGAACVVPTAALLALGGLTWKQCHIYQGLEPLWRDVLRKNPEAWIAHLNLGIMLTKPESLDEALPHLEEAVRLNPDHFRTRHAMGNVLVGRKRSEEAVVHYRRALDIHPTYAAALGNLGLALQSLDRIEEAKTLYENATLSDDAAFAAVGHYHIGLLLLKEGRRDAAKQQFLKSLNRSPNFGRPKQALANMAE
jgi:hypothetical protein